MSDMVSNGYLKDKNGKVMEIVDKTARDGVERLTEEIEKQAVPIILDTDYGGDCDDAQAVRVLCYYDSNGTVGTVGVVSVTANPLNASALHAALEYDGAVDVPVSLANVPSDATPYYYNVLAAYPHNVHTPVDTFGAKTYRKALSALNRKAVLVFVGSLNNLSRLLDSEADEYSSLNGVDLVGETVDKVYIMGGGFPDSIVALEGKGAEVNGVMTPGAEWNFAASIASVDNVVKKCPVPIVFCGWEVGNAIKCGGGISDKLPEKDIMIEAMRIWGGENAVATGRFGWDPITTAIACVGDARKLGFDLVRGTINFNPNDGTNTFTESDDGNHYYVKKRYDSDYYQHYINNILSKKGWGTHGSSDRWRHYLEPSVPCTGLVISENSLMFDTTNTTQLSASALPDNCSEPLVWISSDAEVASVNARGVVTPKANGEAIIYAHCGKKSAACSVVVSAFTDEPEEPDNNGLVYNLQNTTFTGVKSETINTQYPLWQIDRDFTIVTDVTPGTQLSGGGCIWWAQDYDSTATAEGKYIYGGIALDTWLTNYDEWYIEINQGETSNAVRQETGVPKTENRRTVFVVTHIAGSGKYKIIAKADGENVIENVATAEFCDTGKSGNLWIGAADHGQARPFVGTLHELSLYDRVISDDEIAEYLSVN